jgi:hypothetical protein
LLLSIIVPVAENSISNAESFVHFINCIRSCWYRYRSSSCSSRNSYYRQ